MQNSRIGLSDYVAMGLVSCAVLIYEIAIIRVLSVVLWYHFAFLAVSLAMLGLGVPGVWYSLYGIKPGSLRASLLLSGLFIPASIAVILTLGGYVDDRAFLCVACILTPMLSLGSAVCIFLLRAPGLTSGWAIHQLGRCSFRRVVEVAEQYDIVASV